MPLVPGSGRVRYALHNVNRNAAVHKPVTSPGLVPDISMPWADSHQRSPKLFHLCRTSMAATAHPAPCQPNDACAAPARALPRSSITCTMDHRSGCCTTP